MCVAARLGHEYRRDGPPLQASFDRPVRELDEHPTRTRLARKRRVRVRIVLVAERSQPERVEDGADGGNESSTSVEVLSEISFDEVETRKRKSAETTGDLIEISD
ncbi:hypothetical protein CYMTET_21172 [Cymbomonas tetramitiformis]|uniref:Uncharacterized protein n=1 Tax=Cymbomonas tetramitiformis TaxID=36881 RepID=A0AAE0G2F8_9CHLO|nr:hypothetical protein CYMTET_21172 [Cymbomonas tetramitiformis]